MPQSPIPNILSWLTFLPLIGALVIMLLPVRPKDLPEDHGPDGDEQAHADAHSEAMPPADSARNLVNGIAILTVTLTFLLSLALFAAFKSDYVDAPTRNMQFIKDVPWITLGGLHINYRMGVDGISLLLIVLTTFLMVLCVVFSTGTKQRLKEFMVFLLILETGMIGVFCALDLVLFYIFWEAMLVPMYFLIGIFGHERRIYAAIKFFLFTFTGSMFMLIAIVSIYLTTGTFDVLALSNSASGPGAVLQRHDPQALMWMFAAFSLAFMIKVPMFPFHTWLPDAHVEAPTAGSVILAGILLKMGTYGFIRFCLPMFPEQAVQASPLFIALAIVGIVYGSLVSAVQPDAKKLVAYSSVAHLGFAVLGIFTFTRIGLMGALMQNIAHGLATPMLFFLVGMLYERRHTRAIAEFGGLKKVVPMMATMMLIATLASVAVPFFSGFVGEFPVLLGSWTSNLSGPWPTALAATGMILSAVYMLWWFQRLMLGPITKPVNRHLPDLSRNEWVVLAPLAGLIFWVGIYSNFWTQRMTTSVNAVLTPGTDHINADLPVDEMLLQQGLEQRKEEGVGRLRRPLPPVLPPGDMPASGPRFPYRGPRRPSAGAPGGSPAGGGNPNPAPGANGRQTPAPPPSGGENPAGSSSPSGPASTPAGGSPVPSNGQPNSPPGPAPTRPGGTGLKEPRSGRQPVTQHARRAAGRAATRAAFRRTEVPTS
jgi:NADH-quinone oxidoreductase subunit M